MNLTDAKRLIIRRAFWDLPVAWPTDCAGNELFNYSAGIPQADNPNSTFII